MDIGSDTMNQALPNGLLQIQPRLGSCSGGFVRVMLVAN